MAAYRNKKYESLFFDKKRSILFSSSSVFANYHDYEAVLLRNRSHEAFIIHIAINCNEIVSDESRASIVDRFAKFSANHLKNVKSGLLEVVTCAYT